MRIMIVGAGAMGAAIGRLLAAEGHSVITPLAGRSTATRARAHEAGLADAAWSDCAGCDLVLSIVPPEAALPVARDIARALPEGGADLAVVDCNAIAPDEARRMAAIIEGKGALFVDGAFLGGAPSKDGRLTPVLYVSGPASARLGVLQGSALQVKDLQAPIGAASALKMALSGVSKGQTILLVLMTLLARREGVAESFLGQLRESQPHLLAWGRRQIPRLPDTAERWSQEMAVLGDMLAATPGAQSLFEGGEQLLHAFASRSVDAEEQAAVIEAFAKEG